MTQTRELTANELELISGGDKNEATKHPAKVTVPDLKLSISYADHQAWADAV